MPISNIHYGLSKIQPSVLALSGGTFTGDVNFSDDVKLELGADSDGVLLNRSTILNADTALTGVLIGTPDTPALAANSIILSNVTADGDMVLAINDGGTSKGLIFLDGSAGTLNFPLGAIAGDDINVGANLFKTTDLAFKQDDSNIMALVDAGETVYKELKLSQLHVRQGILQSLDQIAFFSGYNADNGYATILARDNGVGLVEVGRIVGAADPYFSFGGSQEFKFYNSGVATLGGDTTMGGNLIIGTSVIDEDSGAVVLYDMSVSAAPADDTEESFSFNIDGNTLLKLYAQADSAGAVDTMSLKAYYPLLFDTSNDSAAVADTVTISGYEIGAGNRVLAIGSETAVAAEVDETKFSHKLQVRINGANYFLMLCAT